MKEMWLEWGSFSGLLRFKSPINPTLLNPNIYRHVNKNVKMISADSATTYSHKIFVCSKTEQTLAAMWHSSFIFTHFID